LFEEPSGHPVQLGAAGQPDDRVRPLRDTSAAVAFEVAPGPGGRWRYRLVSRTRPGATALTVTESPRSRRAKAHVSIRSHALDCA
jgi:hypothetical protein